VVVGNLLIDQGHAALDRISDNYGALVLSDANEAETRHKVIDYLLRDVLGWTEEDISYEERVPQDDRVTYADYIIRTATTQIVVEAKKAGATFAVPMDRRSAKLGGVLREGAVGQAIRQARDYCRAKHIQFAVATNGSCWIVFPAIRTDGVTFDDSMARIFRDLADIHERFVEFWELLSRQRVTDGNLEQELLQQDQIPRAKRLLFSLREPGYRLGRNALFDHIEPAVNVALTEEALVNNIAALEACYVKSSDRVKYDSRLRMYIADQKRSLGHKSIRVRSSRDERYLDSKISDIPRDVLRFILVLGPVGAGKTTFLHYTREISAAEYIDGQKLWIYVDFRKATEQDEPRSFLYKELLRYIEEQDKDFNLGSWESSIMPAYEDVIQGLARGPLFLLKESASEEYNKEITRMVMTDRNEVEPYVERIMRRATELHGGYLVIDNVDQLESDEYQRSIFIEAQAAARRMGFHVIMSLRDVTYLRHRNSPGFDAFEFDSIYIDPPQVAPVLSRRFSYAKRVLAGKSAEIVSERGTRFRVPDVSVFFDIVAQSLLSDNTGYMLELLAGGDTRRGLSLVREFLSSGHTSADRALAVYLQDGRFHFPVHEVFKAIVLGKRKFYRDEESMLPNIFDFKDAAPGAQLLRFRIVQYLVQEAVMPSFEGTRVEAIADQLHRIGIAESDVMRALKQLFDARVLRTADGLEVNSGSVILPTRLAGYVIKELSHWFSYLEMCCIDSSIYSDEKWTELSIITQEIQGISGMQGRIAARIRRVEMFLDYLARSRRTGSLSAGAVAWILLGARR